MLYNDAMSASRPYFAYIALVGLLALLVLIVFFPQSVAKSYHYLSIDVDITVDRDATLTVSETLTQEFQGVFHQSSRYIPLDNLSSIEVLGVVDGENHQAFSFSPERLDKTDPKSWGKYTTYSEKNQFFIEWYFHEENTIHSWTITYKVPDGVRVESGSAILDWNVFTGYHVPIDAASVAVHLPEVSATDKLGISASSEREEWSGSVADGRTLKATRADVPGTGSFRVLATFPEEALKRP
ncbi:MAG: hypothetical protein A2948_00490 [Candidatus Lloydbacteria bacterium RIFCSPLOWO2_01_FULL_54_18]|nr:MAG: hypothetical protein A2948_00490 [Candidatus Lloydbacteria bacterium RIFCSPLOWO2_01_FULL_54_18]